MAKSYKIESKEVSEKITKFDIQPPRKYYVLHLTILDNSQPQPQSQPPDVTKETKRAVKKNPYTLFGQWCIEWDSKKWDGENYQDSMSKILSNGNSTRRWKKVKGQQGMYFTPNPIEQAEASDDRLRLKAVIEEFITEKKQDFSSHAWLSEVFKY